MDFSILTSIKKYLSFQNKLINTTHLHYHKGFHMKLTYSFFHCSKHARRHPNFDLNTLRQRKPSMAVTSQSTIAPKLVSSNSINSSECATSDATSSDSILGL